jgi:hypothetical protein
MCNFSGGAYCFEFICNLRRQQNRLRQMGETVPDEEFKSVLIMSLPESWNPFTSSYQGTTIQKGERGITSQELTSLLIDEYHRHHNNNDEERDLAQHAQPNKKRKVMAPKTTTRKCNICGRTNHASDQCRFKGKPK